MVPPQRKRLRFRLGGVKEVRRKGVREVRGSRKSHNEL